MNQQPQPTWDGVIAELAQVQEAKEKLEDREKELKAMVRQLGFGEHKFTTGGISITPNRRLSAEKAEAAYPIADYPMFYKTSPDSPVIKAKIGQEKYDELMVEIGDPKVSWIK